MFKWRILCHGKLSPEMNMAIDEAVFLEVIRGNSKPTLRFYDWNPPTLSYGYNQNIDKEIDFDLAKKKGFGYVRRPTGGRMVLHKDEVTYSVIAPIAGNLEGNITNSYSAISQALAAGLNRLGIQAEFEKGTLSSSHQRKATNPCFTSSSKYELKLGNKKIVGSAQVRKKNCLLQHGAILLNYDQMEIAEILPNLTASERNKIGNYIKRKTTAINDNIEKKISFDVAVQNLILGFKDNWKNNEFAVGKLLERENKLAKKLASCKYSQDVWNIDNSLKKDFLKKID